MQRCARVPLGCWTPVQRMARLSAPLQLPLLSRPPARALTTLQRAMTIGPNAHAALPSTIRANSLTLSDLHLSSTQVRAIFSWGKKEAENVTDIAAQQTDNAASVSATTQPVLAVPTQPLLVPSTSLTPIPPPVPESKAERLGFGGISAAFNNSSLTWAHIKTYSIYIALGAGVLVVFKIGLNLMEFMASVSLFDVGEVAFVGGVLTGLGVAACAVLGSRWLRLRPEPCFKHAMSRISSDATVAAYMGNTLKSSEFRAYNYVDPSVRLGQQQRAAAATKSGLYKYWQPRRLQLMFQVSGSNGVTGMCTAEVEKTWRGDHQYNLLSVDLIDGRDNSAAERIILEGDPSYRIYKGVVKLR
jgi:hypothetical protein